MDKRIKGLDIKCFRGIPNQLSIDFTNPKGDALSAIIYGENGSGKSSIIDALEFVLQGRIERSNKISNPLRPSASSYSKKHPTGSEVCVRFNDDTDYVRFIKLNLSDEGEFRGYMMEPAGAVDDYSRVPTTLRRNDIISYNYTEEAKRQVLILSFLYKTGGNKLIKTDKDPEIVSGQKQLYELKNQQKEYIRDLLAYGYFGESQVVSFRNDYVSLIRYVNNIVASEKYNGYKSRPIIKISQEEYDKIRQLVKSICATSQDIENAKKQINIDSFLGKGDHGKYLSKVKPILEEASQYMFEAFKEITHIDYIEDMYLSIGDLTVASLDIRLKLRSGVTIAPNRIFSEANYDLMVLLLYISIIRVGVSRGQEKLLVLDDVLQSVDSGIRSRFISYLLSHCGDWQIIITCHDRLWLNHLKYLFNLKGQPFKEFHITNWDFNRGPVIEEKKFETRDTSIDDAIKTSNIRIIAATTGFFFEKICQKLSVSLPTSVKRNEGDRYTIGDLWPNIRKALKNTNIEPTLKLIDELLLIRNLLGCHYNEWADALSDREVHDFANAVKNLYDTVFCDKCFSWVSLGGAKPTIAECRCRSLQITK